MLALNDAQIDWGKASVTEDGRRVRRRTVYGRRKGIDRLGVRRGTVR